MTNMIPKGIEGDLSNVHIYEPHLDAVSTQLNRKVDKYSKCDLLTDYDTNQMLKAFFIQKDYPLDKVLSQVNIKDFTLNNYQSYPAIKANMLVYTK